MGSRVQHDVACWIGLFLSKDTSISNGASIIEEALSGFLGLNHYQPVSNIPFGGKVFENMVASKLQVILDKTDYLDPFQCGFQPGLRWKLPWSAN